MDGGGKRIRSDRSMMQREGEAEPEAEVEAVAEPSPGMPLRKLHFRHRIDVEEGRVWRGVSTIAQRIINGEPPVQAGEECADGEDDDDDDDDDDDLELNSRNHLDFLMDSEDITFTREVKRQRTLRLNRNPRVSERLEKMVEVQGKKHRLGLSAGTMRGDFMLSLKESFHPGSSINWDVEKEVLDAAKRLASGPLVSTAEFQNIVRKDAKLNPVAFQRMIQREKAIDQILEKNPRALDLTPGERSKSIDKLLKEEQDVIEEIPQKKEGKGIALLRRVFRPLFARCCGRGVADQVATPDLPQMPEMPPLQKFLLSMDDDDEDDEEEELDGDDYFQSVIQAREKRSLRGNSSPESPTPVDQRETLREAGFEFLEDWIDGWRDQRFFGPGIGRGPYGRRYRLHGWDTLEINTRIKSLAIQEYWPELEKHYYIDQNGDVSRMAVPDEVIILRKLRPRLHPSLSAVICFRWEPEPAIVMEDTLGGTLDTALFTGRLWAALTVTDILSLLREVAKGLMYIHEKGLVHGDVRPRTIAVHSNLRVAKLCDFGCTTAAGTPVKGGSAAYLAPEAMSILARPCAKVPVGDAHPEQDWYSMGMVVLQMISGRRFSTAHRKTIKADDTLFQPAGQHLQAMRHLDRLREEVQEKPCHRTRSKLDDFLLLLEELNAVYGAMAKKMYPAAKYLTSELVWTEQERLLRADEVCLVLNNLLSMDPRERIPGKLLLELLECEELWERIQEPPSPEEEFPKTTETTPGSSIKELLRKVKVHAKSRNKRGPLWWRKHGRVGHRWWIGPFEDEDFTPAGELNPRYNMDLVNLPFEPWAKKSNVSCRV